MAVILCWLLFYFVPALAVDTRPQSVGATDDFPSLKACVQGCFYGNCGDYVGAAIGCQHGCSSTSSNYCYCREDLVPVANSYLSACVKSSCNVGDYRIDLSSASSIYNGYCTGLTAITTTVAAATPNSSPSPTRTTQAVITETLYVNRNWGGRAATSPGLIGCRYLLFGWVRFP